MPALRLFEQVAQLPGEQFQRIGGRELGVDAPGVGLEVVQERRGGLYVLALDALLPSDARRSLRAPADGKDEREAGQITA